MRISDWSADVCSSDLGAEAVHDVAHRHPNRLAGEHADDESPVVAPDEGESDGADHARQARHELEAELIVEGKILSEGDGAEDVDVRQQVCEGEDEGDCLQARVMQERRTRPGPKCTKCGEENPTT